MLADINALEQFTRQIARGQRTDEIGDRQSNTTGYSERHGMHLDALIPGNYHVVVYVFDRFDSIRDEVKREARPAVRAVPLSPPIAATRPA